MGRPQSVEMALGGNAQQSGNATALAQRRGVRDTCEQMAEIVMRAMRLPLSPRKRAAGAAASPGRRGRKGCDAAHALDACGAMSRGSIGYQTRQVMKDAKNRRVRGDIPVVTLLTRMLVDREDPATPGAAPSIA